MKSTLKVRRKTNVPHDKCFKKIQEENDYHIQDRKQSWEGVHMIFLIIL